MRASTCTNLIRRHLEINKEVVASTLRGLVENYSLQDIFKFMMDITNLAFRTSPVTNEHSTDVYKLVLTIDADDTEKLNQNFVGSGERDEFGHIPPYIASHVHDRDSYSSVDAEVNGEISVHLGTYSDLFVGM